MFCLTYNYGSIKVKGKNCIMDMQAVCLDVYSISQNSNDNYVKRKNEIYFIMFFSKYVYMYMFLLLNKNVEIIWYLNAVYLNIEFFSISVLYFNTVFFYRCTHVLFTLSLQNE